MIRRLIRSLNFRNDKARVPRHQTLVRAVDEQIEIFQNNRPNKCGMALGFDRRRVRSLASQDFKVNALHSIRLAVRLSA